MALPTLPKTYLKDQEFNRSQDLLQSAIAPLLQSPIASPSIITATLTAGDNRVNTGLNKNLTGWIPIRLDAATTLYDKYATQNPQTFPKDQCIVINSSANVNVSFLVF